MRQIFNNFNQLETAFLKSYISFDEPCEFIESDGTFLVGEGNDFVGTTVYEIIRQAHTECGVNRVTRLGEAQYKRAWALANAHSHEWAGYFEVSGSGGIIPTKELIHHTVMAHRFPGDLPGIEAPSIDMGGYISHVTGTGRTTWEIYPDGETVIAIKRPQGQVLRLIITPELSGDDFPETPSAFGETQVHWGLKLILQLPEIEFGERHVGTLLYCLRAILEVENPLLADKICQSVEVFLQALPSYKG